MGGNVVLPAFVELLLLLLVVVVDGVVGGFLLLPAPHGFGSGSVFSMPR